MFFFVFVPMDSFKIKTPFNKMVLLLSFTSWLYPKVYTEKNQVKKKKALLVYKLRCFQYILSEALRVVSMGAGRSRVLYSGAPRGFGRHKLICSEASSAVCFAGG